MPMKEAGAYTFILWLVVFCHPSSILSQAPDVSRV
jgi:hypothetical protein